MTKAELVSGLQALWTWATFEIIDRKDCWKIAALCDAALEMLDGPRARVMALEELPGWDGAFLVESRRAGDLVWASWYAEYELYGDTVTRMVDIGGEVDDRVKGLYGYEWRCWTARPTDEERRTTEWIE